VDIRTDTIYRLRDALIDQGRSPKAPTDTPTSHRQAAMERFAPFAETMYLMMIIDGDRDESELAAISGALHILSDGRLDDVALEELLALCATRADEYGIEGRLQFVGAGLAMDPLDRETAFSLAAAVAIADEILEEGESNLMDSIAEWYGISSRRRREILQLP